MSGTIFVAGFLALFAVFIVYDMIERPKRLKAAQEQDARMADEARSRGWKLEVSREPRRFSYDFSGTSEGIPWKFELRSWESGKGDTRQDRVSSRWFTQSVKTRGACSSSGLPSECPRTFLPRAFPRSS